MNARTVRRILAVYYALAFGAVWLAAPRSGLGDDHTANALLVARALGWDLVIIGIMNWLISSQTGEACRSTKGGNEPVGECAGAV